MNEEHLQFEEYYPKDHVVPQEPIPVSPPPSYSSTKKIILAVSFVLLFVFAITSLAFSYKTFFLQPRDSEEFRNLPQARVLASAIEKQKQITSQKFSGSVTVRVDDDKNEVDDPLNILFSGMLDYSDPQVVNAEAKIDITDIGAVAIKKIKYFYYFNLLFNEENEITRQISDTWYEFDATPHNTNARALLSENNDASAYKIVEKYLEDLQIESIVNLIGLEETETDGQKKYILRLNPGKEDIDVIGRSLFKENVDREAPLSDLIESLTLEIIISSEYRVEKIMGSSRVKSTSYIDENIDYLRDSFYLNDQSETPTILTNDDNSTYDLSFVLQLSGANETFEFNKPENAKSVIELIQTLFNSRGLY